MERDNSQQKCQGNVMLGGFSQNDAKITGQLPAKWWIYTPASYTKLNSKTIIDIYVITKYTKFLLKI